MTDKRLEILTVTVVESGADVSVRLMGPLTVETPDTAWREVSDFNWTAVGEPGLGFDLSGLTALDLNGAAQLLTVMKKAEKAGRTVVVTGLPADLAPVLTLATKALEAPPTAPPPRVGFVEEIGHGVMAIKSDLVGLTTFAGELLAHFIHLLRRPDQVRWKSVFKVAEKAGVDAVPIVSLVSFLVGLIIAFQTAMVLKMVGAAIWVADMVGVAVVRELGPLIAAIVLAGRSGSAFSAELGAMKAAEEVDAITTMGLSPVRELAVPRVLASLLTTPIVSLIACFAGIFGGSLVLLAMGYSMTVFWQEAVTMVSAASFYISLFKSVLFGFTVATIGCQRGLAAGDGPGAVGEATTSGVVTNIVIIAVLDSILAVLFYVWDI